METEAKRGRAVAYLPISKLHHHPKNPRKDIGDITELIESIKKNGIMQNLTVIEGFYRETNGEFFNTDTEYTVIIGHRRLEAAKAAGLFEVPCRIYKNIPESEQITTMLEENMQRNDLTPIEQADSFQLCLDLGETVDSIAEKTGFSKSTVYHRINLGKLDRSVVEAVEEDDSFQITMKDYIELEKIKNVETRNKVLRDSRNSNDLRFRAEQAAKGEKREALEEDARKILEQRGLKEGQASNQWDGKYDRLYSHNVMENDMTNAFEIPDEIDEQIEEGSVYLISWGEIKILNPKAETQEEDDEPDEGPSEWEIERQEREKRNTEYRNIRDRLEQKTHDFVMSIVTGKLEDIDKAEVVDYSEQMLNLIMDYDEQATCLDWEDLIKFITGKDKYDFETEDEFFEEVEDLKNELPLHHKLLIAMAATMNEWKTISYTGEYLQDIGKLLMQGYCILERWDFKLEFEERLLLNGCHALYKDPEEDEDV